MAEIGQVWRAKPEFLNSALYKDRQVLGLILKFFDGSFSCVNQDGRCIHMYAEDFKHYDLTIPTIVEVRPMRVFEIMNMYFVETYYGDLERVKITNL